MVGELFKFVAFTYIQTDTQTYLYTQTYIHTHTRAHALLYIVNSVSLYFSHLPPPPLSSMFLTLSFIPSPFPFLVPPTLCPLRVFVILPFNTLSLLSLSFSLSTFIVLFSPLSCSHFFLLYLSIFPSLPPSPLISASTV